MNEKIWNDFNSATDESVFDIIPSGTLAKVLMTIKPGGYNDPSMGWNDDMATQSANTGSIYLSCEYVILEGKYHHRKIWGLIGLYSPKGPDWGNMGRTFIKKILNSSRGLQPKDNSARAQQLRCIKSFSELNGMEFVVKIDKEEDMNGDMKNIVKSIITPDNKDYDLLMGHSVQLSPQEYYPQQQAPLQRPQQPQQAQETPPPLGSYYPPQQPQQQPQQPQQPQQRPQDADIPTWAK